MPNSTNPSPLSQPALQLSVDGRKRHRSLSMESTTSASSRKRSASEDPTASSPVTRSTRLGDTTPSLSDPASNDIDAYMISQGESDLLESTLLPPPYQSNPSLPDPIPHHVLSSTFLRFQAVKIMRDMPLIEGSTWALVSRAWWRRFEKAATGQIDKEGQVDEDGLGPVDNSSLFDVDGSLNENLVEGVDFDCVPEAVWDWLTVLYGTPKQTPIKRKVITRGIKGEPSIELHPPRFRYFLLTDEPANHMVHGAKASYFTTSRVSTTGALHRDLAAKFDRTEEHRIWQITLSNEPTGTNYPSGALDKSEARVIESGDKLVGDVIGASDAFIVEFKANGGWITDTADTNHSGLVDDRTPLPLFGQGPDFFSRMSGSSNTSLGRSTLTINGLTSPSGMSSTSSLNKSTTMTTRPRSSIKPGTLGLGNLGNTCFMNSAIQCLAHTPQLTDYFLTGVFTQELNPDNPLGMHGEIARSFGALLQRIWSETSQGASYAPREFKSVLSRFAPQFSGYQQHDTQEFVAFLLDGLHEDLNRVLKKPYVEKPDWNGGSDLELVKLACSSWEGYMKRNDSVIVDLFQGQYRSTLVCPECSKVSITFDPFMYLTLPLPVNKKWRHEIYYIPWDADKIHVKIPVELNRDASFRDLRALLGRWMGTNPDNMAENDKIVCYELPCHAQQARNYTPKQGDPFIVPVFLCDATVGRITHTTFSRPSPLLFGNPFVIAIPPEDAHSTVRMKELVVKQLQRWTDNARDLWSWEALEEPDPDAEMEEVHIPTTLDAPMDAVTEIKENGDVFPVEDGEIVDQKALLYEDDDDIPILSTPASKASSSVRPDVGSSVIPSQDVRRVGVKAGAFALRVQSGHKDFGTGVAYAMSSSPFDSWDARRDEFTGPGNEDPVLLLPDDALFLEFDQNMKAYYFGTGPQAFHHGLFNTWETLLHPEYSEAVKAAAAKMLRGISLQDCLDEFTKEEQLGEDDPWYCPQCKKHQQATKKFDLWNVPDVLVVHLKRFSNSRALRDKIEAFVDFPIEGLDLTEMVQERKIAKQLQERGVDIGQLRFGDLDEPLLYDLYAVDEHRGGLGGGHYRAYAFNDLTSQWYQFDDAFVSLSRPGAAVNSDAYLLFYKRRTSRPLGGKTHRKIEAARLNSEPSSVSETPVPVHINEQLPTPPDEPLTLVTVSSSPKKTEPSQANHNWPSTGRWPTPQSESSSISTSPPPLDEPDSELPSFAESQFDEVLQESLDPLVLSSRQFDYGRGSPTSSNEVEVDSDDERSGHVEADSTQASPREEMLRDAQDGTDLWNT
ncbi:hypothetical protein F5148DRAFT_1171203 [Russula earlei]|uniref:Uncharacterized protein n=1 Tax=Russula earlei TaxID=71964 RepID=A0ACC0UIH5_9AGAM|nr:hypothetical protein F5148DRAFT_1171203 [Russula earlei]